MNKVICTYVRKDNTIGCFECSVYDAIDHVKKLSLFWNCKEIKFIYKNND